MLRLGILSIVYLLRCRINTIVLWPRRKFQTAITSKAGNELGWASALIKRLHFGNAFRLRSRTNRNTLDRTISFPVDELKFIHHTLVESEHDAVNVARRTHPSSFLSASLLHCGMKLNCFRVSQLSDPVHCSTERAISCGAQDRYRALPRCAHFMSCFITQLQRGNDST